MTEPMLRIAQVSPDTDAEGPGRRFAVWVQGCRIRCALCCNPEMFGARGGREVTPTDLAGEVLAANVDGVSVLGGEPFDQPAGVAALCQAVRRGGGSVVVFTGYVLEDLQARHDPDIDALLATIDLLIDGPFDHTQPESERRWVGSTNQRFHFFTDRYSMGDPQFWTSNTVEIRFDGNEVTINGWPAQADAIRAALGGKRR